jgi:ribonuclease E
VQLPVEVATYLLNEKRDDVAKIEQRLKVRIVLIPNVNLDSPHYKIRKITNDGYDSIVSKMSYNLVEHIEAATP